MPKVKVEPGKITVCCGDSDCVELDTSADAPVLGGVGSDNLEPPISGGVAVYGSAPRTLMNRLVLNADVTRNEFQSSIDAIAKHLALARGDANLEHVVQLTVPKGSRLRIGALRALSEHLKTKVEVRFNSKDQ